MVKTSSLDLFEGLPLGFEKAARKAVADILAPSIDREFRPAELALRIQDKTETLAVIFRIPFGEVREILKAILNQQEDFNPPPNGDFRNRENHDWMLQQTS